MYSICSMSSVGGNSTRHVEHALVGGHQHRGDVDQLRHVVPPPGRLGDHEASVGVPDEDRRLVEGVEEFADRRRVVLPSRSAGRSSETDV